MKNIFAKVLSVLVLGILCCAQPAAAAQSYNIKEMTPQVQSALDGRRDRYEELSALKAKGVIGENNRGYVQALKSEGNVDALVKGENSDRKAIYQAIAEQNNLSGEIETIDKVFASVQRDKAGSGEMIQTEDGRWVSK